ncbi:MAG: hypothetical protein AAF221_07890 [Pseudomonadota bacterium]
MAGNLYMNVLLLAAYVVVASAGSLGLKHFADTGASMSLWGGLAALMAANGIWISIAANQGLGFAALVCSLSTTIFLVVVASWWFGETLTALRCAGLVAGLIAITLFNIPNQQANILSSETEPFDQNMDDRMNKPQV